MATVLLFHHALGLTPGCLSFADELRAAGHVVHTPDLFEGKLFTDVSAGVSHAQEIGFEGIMERGRLVAEKLPSDIIYAGFSLGVMPAQKLAQTRGGTKGAIFMYAAVETSYFGPWPKGLPLQMHTTEEDGLGDVDIMKALAKEIEGAELFLYPGDKHLFADQSTPDYDAASAALLMQRVLAFLSKNG